MTHYLMLSYSRASTQPGSFLMDCLCLWCCPTCLLCQELNELERAKARKEAQGNTVAVGYAPPQMGMAQQPVHQAPQGKY